MVENMDRGLGKLAENATGSTLAAPLDLGSHSAADKRVAAKQLASSDELLVKANLLPSMPNFPVVESVAGAKIDRKLDDNQQVTSETRTLPNSLIPGDKSSDLKQVVKFDANGAVTSTDTSWKDAQNKSHDVLTANGTTTNTIVDGARTEKLITYANSKSWEHDVAVKSDDGKKVLFKDNLTVGNSGHVNFEDKFVAETQSGKQDFHRWARYDKNQKVEIDHSQWRGADGLAHETDNFNYGDAAKSNLSSKTAGDLTQSTRSDKDHPSSTVVIKANGDVTGADGVTRKPDGEVVKQTW